MGALAYSHYVTRSFRLCGVRALHPAPYNPPRQPSRWPPTKKTMVPCLSSSRSDWHILHRRCQPALTPTHIKCFTASVPIEANNYIYTLRGGGRQNGFRPDLGRQVGGLWTGSLNSSTAQTNLYRCLCAKNVDPLYNYFNTQSVRGTIDWRTLQRSQSSHPDHACLTNRLGEPSPLPLSSLLSSLS